MNNTSFITEIRGLVRWSIYRHKHLILVFSIAQMGLSLAIVYGMALMLSTIQTEDAIYLSAGAITLGIIAVGCVLSAQIISTAKQEGIIKYQKTLPVSRLYIVLSDILIWGTVSLPGVAMSCIAANLRFDLTIHISFYGVLIILLAQICMICIGFSIAYWLSSNMVALATQVIMIGGLLFSPILFPADRLPSWMLVIYNNLPFVPTSNLIRWALFEYGTFSIRDLVVIIFWGIATLLLSLSALSRRN